MNHILRLPNDYLAHIFTNWISLSDIARLDSSCCCYEIRAGLLKTLYRDLSIYSSDGVFLTASQSRDIMDSFISWTLLKGIALVDTMLLSQDSLERVSLLNEQSAAGVARIVITDIDTWGENYLSVIDKVWSILQNVLKIRPTIKFFHIHTSQRDMACPYSTIITNQLFALLALNCSNLLKIWFTGYSGVKFADSDIQICSSIAKFPLLQELVIPHVHIQDRTLLALSTHCPDLKILDVRFGRVSTSAVEQLARKCPLLESLGETFDGFSSGLQRLYSLLSNLTHFFSSINIPKDFLSTTLPRLPRLRSIQLLSIDDLSESDYAAIAEHCPNLESLCLNENRFSPTRNLSDDRLLRIVRGCPNIRAVQLNYCSLLTTVGVAGMMTGLPNLRDLRAHGSLGKVDIPHIISLGPNLRHVRVAGENCSSVLGSKLLAAVTESCGELRELYVSGCSQAAIEKVLAHARSRRSGGGEVQLLRIYNEQEDVQMVQGVLLPVDENDYL